MFTNKCLNRLSLSVEMVKQFGVAGEHAATGGTSNELFLSVSAHVLPQTITDLEESVTASPVAEQSLMLLGFVERLRFSTFDMIFHMTIKPFRVIKSTL